MAHQRAQRVLLAVPVAAPAPALRRRELEHPARPLPRPDERVEEVGDVLGGVVDFRMPGRDDEDGPLGGAREARDDQPARGAPEPAGRQTQLSLGEGVGEVLERPPASECGGLIGHATCGLAEDTSKGGEARIGGLPGAAANRATNWPTRASVASKSLVHYHLDIGSGVPSPACLKTGRYGRRHDAGYTDPPIPTRPLRRKRQTADSKGKSQDPELAPFPRYTDRPSGSPVLHRPGYF